MLARRLPPHRETIAGCAARGDGRLFHALLDRALRDIRVARFAAHGYSLPSPTRLHHRVARFALDADIAALERAPGADLARKADIIAAMGARVLALPGDRWRGASGPPLPARGGRSGPLGYTLWHHPGGVCMAGFGPILLVLAMAFAGFMLSRRGDNREE